MVTRESQLPLCPVCHKADKVKKLETAYNEGLERFAPPPLPGKTVSVVRYMVSSMILIGLFIFFILVLVGSESFGQGFSFVELALVLGATASIIAALVLSYIAFTKVVRGDQDASKHYAEWDLAMERYKRLLYCSRDNVIFDPQTQRIVSEEELASLMSTEAKNQQASQQSTSLAH
ncbi:MAG: hypothetical protein E6J31_07690 [Chloroflexi bacterium]|nr:MAG: hypothetical protein E6J31_07690 [Chloroflexota bacterium]TMC95756.1 MAG: hypothetical protein E6J11_12940 [Chloroflexota bacterium]TMD38227.1 MAG: hypothetical protein E6J04_02135 [Chloroflexota bacterium]